MPADPLPGLQAGGGGEDWGCLGRACERVEAMCVGLGGWGPVLLHAKAQMYESYVKTGADPALPLWLAGAKAGCCCFIPHAMPCDAMPCHAALLVYRLYCLYCRARRPQTPLPRLPQRSSSCGSCSSSRP